MHQELSSRAKHTHWKRAHLAWLGRGLRLRNRCVCARRPLRARLAASSLLLCPRSLSSPSLRVLERRCVGGSSPWSWLAQQPGESARKLAPPLAAPPAQAGECSDLVRRRPAGRRHGRARQPARQAGRVRAPAPVRGRRVGGERRGELLEWSRPRHEASPPLTLPGGGLACERPAGQPGSCAALASGGGRRQGEEGRPVRTRLGPNWVSHTNASSRLPGRRPSGRPFISGALAGWLAGWLAGRRPAQRRMMDSSRSAGDAAARFAGSTRLGVPLGRPAGSRAADELAALSSLRASISQPPPRLQPKLQRAQQVFVRVPVSPAIRVPIRRRRRLCLWPPPPPFGARSGAERNSTASSAAAQWPFSIQRSAFSCPARTKRACWRAGRAEPANWKWKAPPEPSRAELAPLSGRQSERQATTSSFHFNWASRAERREEWPTEGGGGGGGGGGGLLGGLRGELAAGPTGGRHSARLAEENANANAIQIRALAQQR